MKIAAWVIVVCFVLNFPLEFWMIGRPRKPRGRDDAFLGIVGSLVPLALAGRILGWW